MKSSRISEHVPPVREPNPGNSSRQSDSAGDHEAGAAPAGGSVILCRETQPQRAVGSGKGTWDPIQRMGLPCTWRRKNPWLMPGQCWGTEGTPASTKAPEQH